MKLKRGIYVLFLLLSFAFGKVQAQNVYFCEFGLSGGCGFVLGDVNGMLFNYVQPLGGVMYRYKFNGHWEIRVQGEGGLLGVKKNGGDQKNMVFGGGQVLGEFNFFNFGVKKWEEYRTWVSPALVLGIGFIGFNGGFAATVPMGIGVKFRLSDRVNMGAYWMVNKAFTDKLDYVDDPLGLNKGFWNNRDWYSTAQIYISINWLKECAPCRNGVTVKKKY